MNSGKYCGDIAVPDQESHLSMALAAAFVGTHDWDLVNDKHVWSDEVYKMLGLDPSESQLASVDEFIEFVHPDDKGWFHRETALLLEKKTTSSGELRVVRKDQTINWLEYRANIFRDQTGRPLNLFAILIDINAAKQAEKAEKAESDLRQQYERLLNNNVSAVLVHNGSYWLYANPAAARMLKAPSVEALIGAPVALHVPREKRSEHKAIMSKVISDRIGMKTPEEFQGYLKCDGTKFDMVAITFPIEWNNKPAAQLILHEVTERNKAVTALSQREIELKSTREKLDELAHIAHQNRLMSMGELASAISHELNQPLMAISSNSYLLQQESAKLNSAAVNELAEKIGDQAVAAGEIIHRMKGFVGKSTSIREWVSVGGLVNAAAKIAEPQTRRLMVEFELEIADDIPDIFADPIQIQQVLLNLILNASEAMKENTSPRKIHIKINTTGYLNDFVAISVADTGSGLEPKNFERVFEPFESSKTDGMGMGLAICRKITDDHSGTLLFNSESNNGATIVLTLPVKSS